jgi:hypothetical protein
MPRCSSCGAEVVYVVTAKAGKPMPCDPELVTVHLASLPQPHLVPVTVTTDEGATHRGYSSMPAGELFDRTVTGRVSHFATCPEAARHRKT